MKTLNELLKEAQRIGREIRNVQRACGYDDCSDLSCLEIPMQDAEGLFLWDELRYVMDKLADAQAALAYLNTPVQTEGVLRWDKKTGRYRFKGVELSCGMPIEMLVKDDYRDNPYWCAGRIEHDGNDYYFTGAKKMPLKGAKARIRG